MLSPPEATTRRGETSFEFPRPALYTAGVVSTSAGKTLSSPFSFSSLNKSVK
jgi:hypothetical protein